MNENSKLLGMLGLSMKAGKLVCGCEAICDKVRTGKNVYLVIISSDVAQNTKKRLVNCCRYYGVEYRESSVTQSEMSHAVGKTSSVSSVAVLDENFGNAIIKLV